MRTDEPLTKLISPALKYCNKRIEGNKMKSDLIRKIYKL
jgi:hypothetical protein